MAFWLVKHYLKELDDETTSQFDPFMNYLSILMTPIVNESAS